MTSYLSRCYTIKGSFFPTLSHVHVVKQDLEGIHHHLVGGGGGGGEGIRRKGVVGIIFVGGGGGGGGGVLTIINCLYVEYEINNSLL